MMSDLSPPTLAELAATATAIAPYISQTPVHLWQGPLIEEAMGADTRITLKLELFQRAGSFKARGALANMLSLDKQAKAKGVTAVSAGNHAIAVSYAAKALGVSAKVVMQSSANPARVEAARALGAEVIIGGDGPSSFAKAEAIADTEGRTFIHPFEGKGVALGTGTLGLEFLDAAGDLDALVLPIGGGGLAGGVCAAIRQVNPEVQLFGVEPEGAPGMTRSFAAGAVVQLDKVETIADSLGPPMTLPYSFGLCRDHIDTLVNVDDDSIAAAAYLLFREMKLAVEPAGAAAVAGMLGPLKQQLQGKSVGIIICGTNIDAASHAALMQRGMKAAS